MQSKKGFQIKIPRICYGVYFIDEESFNIYKTKDKTDKEVICKLIEDGNFNIYNQYLTSSEDQFLNIKNRVEYSVITKMTCEQFYVEMNNEGMVKRNIGEF